MSDSEASLMLLSSLLWIRSPFVCNQNPQDQTFQDAPVVIVEVMSGSDQQPYRGQECDACFTIPSHTYQCCRTRMPLQHYERPGDEFVRRLEQIRLASSASAGHQRYDCAEADRTADRNRRTLCLVRHSEAGGLCVARKCNFAAGVCNS